MNALDGMFHYWPAIAAFVVAAMIPNGERKTRERLGLGIVAAVLALAVQGLWPGDGSSSVAGAAGVAGGAAPAAPSEWPHLLNVLVFLPIVGAVAVLFLPRQLLGVLRGFTMAVMGVTFVASLWLLAVPMTQGWHFQYIRPWIPAIGVRYHVALDGISLWLVLLTTFITPIAAYAAFGSIRTRIKELCFSFLLLQGAMIGVFVALDLFLFYVFWEVVLVPMYVMIGVWGGVDRIRAAVKFFLYTMAGSMLMLAAIVYLVWTYQKLTGQWTFDYLALSRMVLPAPAQHASMWQHVTSPQGLCFWAFSIAFFIKVPMWPVHTWLPDAHVQAPTAGSIVLAAVMLKLGTYAYLRFSMGLFPGMASHFTGNLAGVAILGGIIYGALVAWKQDDVKRLVAYSSVAHLGYVMLGLFSVTTSGMQGAVLQMVNHGVSTGALFLLVGVIYDRRHTRMVDELGGLAKVMPIYAAVFCDRHHGVGGRARHQRLHRRVHGHHRHLRLGAARRLQRHPDGRRRGRRHPRRRVHALGRAEDVLRPPLQPQEPAPQRPQPARDPRPRAPGRDGLRHRPLPERLPRPDQGLGAARPQAVHRRVGPGHRVPLRGARRLPPPGRPALPRVPQGRARGEAQTALSHRPQPRSGAMKLGTYVGLAPLLIVVLGGTLLMVAEAFSHRREEGDTRHTGPSSDLAIGTAITLFAGALAAVGVWFVGPEKLEGLDALRPYLVIDRFTLFFTFLLCLGGGLAALLAGGYLPEHRIDRGEFYPLLTFSTVGAIALAAAEDLLTLFLALETMSLGVYCLTGFRRASPRSTEAAIKYFLLGSFAAALLLYGGALLYGATGHTDLPGIRAAIVAGTAPGGHVNAGLVLIAAALVLAGLLFKVSAVPFHMWTPDAYEGAPTPATGYMAVAVKSAAFAVLLRVLLVAFGQPELTSFAGWPPIVAFLAVLTMTVANLVAGRQESVKRMLAYSSIAHAGYVLVGVVSTIREGADAQGSVMFYLLVYTASTIGAFGALILCGSRGAEAVSYEDLAGVGKRHPTAALAFSLFLLSLAGVPPTAGFFGKFYVVRAAVGANLYPLAVILVLNSLLGAYYYLRVLVFMYMREPAPGAAVATPMRSGYVATALIVAAVLVVMLGIWPTTSLQMAIEAAIATR